MLKTVDGLLQQQAEGLASTIKKNVTGVAKDIG